MSTIIQLKNISKHYGSVVGVDDVNLSVKDGEFLTLLGPSGCGKSTLLRMIGGFEVPTSGTIILADEDVTYTAPQHRDVNMMFQDYALFPHMSVGDNIAYGLKRKGFKGSAATNKVKEALRLVGLEEKIDQRPHQLSGGQKQRVALARAIVREPKVLLLDEPLSALDANLREQMQIELKHMHNALGITFIMVTHDQTEALVMSDRVMVMDKGTIAQDGTPEDLYERPSSAYVANFIGTTNFLPATFISKDSSSTNVNVMGNRFAVSIVSQYNNDSPLQIGIRSEKIRLCNADDIGDSNTLTGVVAETIYLGLGLRSIVKLADETVVLVDTTLPQGLSRTLHPVAGDTVTMAIDPQSVFLFEAEA